MVLSQKKKKTVWKLTATGNSELLGPTAAEAVVWLSGLVPTKIVGHSSIAHNLFHPFPFVYSVAAVEVKASLSTLKANESNRLKMRKVLPVSLASTKEGGSQTSPENELISDCEKLYPCASVAVGVK